MPTGQTGGGGDGGVTITMYDLGGGVSGEVVQNGNTIQSSDQTNPADYLSTAMVSWRQFSRVLTHVFPRRVHTAEAFSRAMLRAVK